MFQIKTIKNIYNFKTTFNFFHYINQKAIKNNIFILIINQIQLTKKKFQIIKVIQTQIK